MNQCPKCKSILNKQEISVRRVKAFWTLIFLQEKQVMRKNL